jgi:hypothetical protein
MSGDLVKVYVKAKQINEVNPNYETLTVSLVNGISLFGTFWLRLVFSFIVNHLGYSIVWLLGGFIYLCCYSQ